MVLRSQNRLGHSRIRGPISSPDVCLALFGCCFQSCVTMVMRTTLELQLIISNPGRLCFSSLLCKCSHRPIVLWEYLLPCISPEFTVDSAMMGAPCGKFKHTLSFWREQWAAVPITDVLETHDMTHCLGKSKSSRVTTRRRGSALHPVDNHVLWGSTRSVMSWLYLLSHRLACSSLTEYFWSHPVWVPAQI